MCPQCIATVEKRPERKMYDKSSDESCARTLLYNVVTV